ncbi:MAG: hypothetical protein Q9161_008188 [Pseudevernia consocians]
MLQRLYGISDRLVAFPSIASEQLSTLQSLLEIMSGLQLGMRTGGQEQRNNTMIKPYPTENGRSDNSGLSHDADIEGILAKTCHFASKMKAGRYSRDAQSVIEDIDLRRIDEGIDLGQMFPDETGGLTQTFRRRRAPSANLQSIARSWITRYGRLDASFKTTLFPDPEDLDTESADEAFAAKLLVTPTSASVSNLQIVIDIASRTYQNRTIYFTPTLTFRAMVADDSEVFRVVGGGSVKKLGMLLSSGAASLGDCDSMGRSLLHNLILIVFNLYAGTDLSSVIVDPAYDESAFTDALRYGTLANVKALLDLGGRFISVDFTGDQFPNDTMPLQLLAYGHFMGQFLNSQIDKIALLLSRGADVKARGFRGRTCLQLSSSSEDDDDENEDWSPVEDDEFKDDEFEDEDMAEEKSMTTECQVDIADPQGVGCTFNSPDTCTVNQVSDAIHAASSENDDEVITPNGGQWVYCDGDTLTDLFDATGAVISGLTQDLGAVAGLLGDFAK